MSKCISIWGSTGSIGRQTLEVVAEHADQFRIEVLTANRNGQLLAEQARLFHPKSVVLVDKDEEKRWKDVFENLDIELLTGKEGLLEIAGRGKEDLIVNGLVGAVGLEATIKAIQAGVDIALANKEVLVMAGELVTKEISSKGVHLYPVDSEHSAIYQCLQGENHDAIRGLILTASGGPFLHKDASELAHVTVEEALNHPNWSMGKKITIDSATLMNKALEIIEARWLFDIQPEKIHVVMHPQSIIHSMVEFVDGSIKAQLGMPDMRVPISYALGYPKRLKGVFGSMDFSRHHQIEFFPPDPIKFPSLRLAYKALDIGGTAPAVLNGADEQAVQLFLDKKIPFNHIFILIESALEAHQAVSNLNLGDILEADRWVRDHVQNRIEVL